METQGGTVTDPKAYKPGAGAGHSWHIVSSKQRLAFISQEDMLLSVCGVRASHGGGVPGCTYFPPHLPLCLCHVGCLVCILLFFLEELLLIY